MRLLILTFALGLATISQANAEVTLTIKNEDLPTGSSCKGSGTTLIKMSEGKDYDLVLGSDCSVTVRNVTPNQSK